MRFFHLSDLHIGKIVYGYSMKEEMRHVFSQLFSYMETYRPDAVVIAGDIYDKSVPSIEAGDLFDELLGRLADYHVPVLIVSGNHDSGERLKFGRKLFRKGQIYIESVFHGQPAKITVEAADGAVNFYLLPFVRPADVRHAIEIGAAGGLREEDGPRSVGGPREETGLCGVDNPREAGGSREAAGSRGVDGPREARIDTYQQAVSFVMGQLLVDTGERNVLVAHQFLTGAKKHDGGSENISVGGVDHVDASCFAAFDYVALGHLHTNQNVGEKKYHYCGTPLAYSFSEKEDKKGITMVTLGKNKELSLEQLPLEPLHKMTEVRGTFEEIERREKTMDYVRAVVTDDAFHGDIFGKLHTVFPNLMTVEFERKNEEYAASAKTVESITDKQPQELFADFFYQQTGNRLEEEEKKIVADLFEKLQTMDCGAGT